LTKEAATEDLEWVKDVAKGLGWSPILAGSPDTPE